MHACFAVGCAEQVFDKLLMCPRHWYMVPLKVRRRVWDAYRPGQGFATASEEWHEAVQEAVRAVQRIELAKTPNP